jgi:hypothetical protein
VSRRRGAAAVKCRKFLAKTRGAVLGMPARIMSCENPQQQTLASGLKRLTKQGLLRATKDSARLHVFASVQAVALRTNRGVRWGVEW